MDALLDPLRETLAHIIAYLPAFGFAVVVVIAGWLLAKAARFALVKAMRAINFNVLTERAGLDEFLRQGGIKSDTTDIFGVLVYWLIVLAAIVVAFNALNARLALATLSGTTILVALVSEVFVESLQQAAVALGMTTAFVGFVIVALVGGAVLIYRRRRPQGVGLAVHFGTLARDLGLTARCGRERGDERAGSR